MLIRIFLLISICTLIFKKNAYSQHTTNAITFELSEKELMVKDKSLHTLTLKIVNHSDSTISGTVITQIDQTLTLISRASYLVALKAGESRFLPIKFMAGNKMAAAEPGNLSLNFSDGKEMKRSASCIIKMGVIKSVTLNTLVSSLVLGIKGDSLQIPVRISNTGNVTQRVNIICQLPPELQIHSFHTPIPLKIPPYTDTLIHINKRITRNMLNVDNFNISLWGIDENGDVFGQQYVQVQHLKNKRSYHAQLPPQEYLGTFVNSFTLASQNLGSNFSSHQFYGGTSVETPYGRLGFNADATFWKNSNKPYLRETYVSYENSQMGISAGTMSRNMETNINGQGVTAFFLDTTTTNTYEIGFIENQWNTRDKTGWAKFNHSHKDFKITSSAMHGGESYTRTNNTIIANEFRLTKFKNFDFTTELNLAQTADQLHKHNKKYAYLASLTLGMKLGAFNLNTMNTLSSSYYPGLRRGYKSFNERINYNWKKLNLWANYSYNETKPDDINSLSYTYAYETGRADIGASLTINKFFLSLSPLYTAEKSSYFYLQQALQTGQIRSFRLATQLNYSNAEKNIYMFLSVENGAGKEVSTAHYQNQLKANASLRWGILNVNGNWQSGTFYASDLFNRALLNNRENKNLNINTTLRKEFFHKKAVVDAGVNFNKNSFSGKSFLFTGRSSYQVNKKMKVFAALLRTNYQFMNYSFNNLQLGVTQDLPGSKIGSKNKTLEVLIYHDHNKNGSFDEGDVPAKSQLIYVNNTAFLSNNQGKITYKNLVPGNYRVKTPLKGNWFGAEQHVVMNKENLSLEIPLHKTGVLQGNINYIFNKYSHELNNKQETYTIIARNKEGKIEKTRTDESGRFTFYLPINEYTISIEALPQQVECLNDNMGLAVTEEGQQRIILQLKVKERTIKTQKFISKNAKEKK